MEPRAGDGFHRLVTGRPWQCLGAAVLLLLVAFLALVDPISGTPRIALDPSTDSMLPQADPAEEYFQRIRHLFGSEETLLVVLTHDDVFTPEVLTAVQRLTEEIENLDVVERVSSLSTSINIRSEAGELRVDPFFEEVPTDPEGLADLRRRALDDPIYAGNLVSPDGTATLINVHLLDLTEQEILESGVDQTIARLAREGSGPAEVSISGSPHIKAEMNRIMIHSMTVLVPLSWLGMGLWAFLIFRTLRGVLIPLLTIQIALVLTLAVVASIYGSLNILTIAAPPILLVFGLAYTIHVLSCYYDAVRGRLGPVETPRDAAFLALRHVAVPTVFTGLTTAVGFFSLVASPLPAVREFGVFCGAGAVVTALVALTIAPAVLALLPIPRRIAEARGETGAVRGLRRLARVVARRRPVFIGVWVGLGILALAGVPQVAVRTSNVKDMRPDNPVRRDFDRVNELLEGANAINVVVESPTPGGFLEPRNLSAIEGLAAWIETQPEVGGTTSLVDYVKAINRGFHEDSAHYDAVPESQELVSQLLLVGANDELPQFVDGNFQIANILVRTSAVDTDEVSNLADRIEAVLPDQLEGLQATVTGNAVLLSRTMDDIAIGQAISLVLALVIIYGVLVFLFTSFRIGLIALIPNALPVAFFFGILGWFDFPLNTSTSLVACLVLGIAVDDTIHLLVRFNDASKHHADERQGIEEALTSVGPPVTYTTGALVLGFLFQIPSGLETLSDFGLLCSVTLAIAWVIDLTFTPALAMGMKIVTIWDLLTLDLGDKPHRSIPIFRGMREHQARLVALLTSMQRIPAGTQLISVGDPGGEMFIVIDGELAASIARDGQRVHLRNLGRGDVIGEVGIFFGARTADVRANTDVRLVRLTQESLERLARRHPRVATRLYANLSRVLAQRLANVTRRVG